MKRAVAAVAQAEAKEGILMGRRKRNEVLDAAGSHDPAGIC